MTQQLLAGNPLAVFHAAEGLPGRTMQRIARELNLSETVFVLPATLPHRRHGLCDRGVHGIEVEGYLTPLVRAGMQLPPTTLPELSPF